jgi:hypothetical protein
MPNLKNNILDGEELLNKDNSKNVFSPRREKIEKGLKFFYFGIILALTVVFLVIIWDFENLIFNNIIFYPIGLLIISAFIFYINQFRKFRKRNLKEQKINRLKRLTFLIATIILAIFSIFSFFALVLIVITFVFSIFNTPNNFETIWTTAILIPLLAIVTFQLSYFFNNILFLIKKELK